MLFAIYCTDRPNSQELRIANRQAHLDHLAKYADHLVMAGPMLTDDGEAMIGSLLIMDFPDRAAVESYAAADPYFTAGLFESVSIRRWKKVLPQT